MCKSKIILLYKKFSLNPDLVSGVARRRFYWTRSSLLLHYEDLLVQEENFVVQEEASLEAFFWPSPAFLASHPVIAKLLHRKMALSGGAWQWCSRGSAEAARGAKAKSQVIVLTNRGEMFGSMAHIGHKFCAEDALAYFCTIDEQRCML